jgi:hypothetical protein
MINKANTNNYKRNNKNIYSGKKSHKKLGIEKERNHLSIYNNEGLKTAVSKYNEIIKSDNKSTFSDGHNKNINNDINSINDSAEKIKSITKLKEMNSNMDLLLTKMKDELDCIKNNRSEKNIINISNFIQQIDIKKDNNLSSEFNNNNKQESINFRDNSSSLMSITNFNFEIINKKKYFIDTRDLNEEQKIKMKYVFNNKLNNKLFVDEIINNTYEYKNKYEKLKNENNSLLSTDEDYFKEIIKNNFDYNKIKYENEILKKEIDILKQNLTNSIYNGDLILKRYYDKLNEINIKIQKTINELTNDILDQN